jgi:hypothetical protein
VCDQAVPARCSMVRHARLHWCARRTTLVWRRGEVCLCVAGGEVCLSGAGGEVCLCVAGGEVCFLEDAERMLHQLHGNSNLRLDESFVRRKQQVMDCPSQRLQQQRMHRRGRACNVIQTFLQVTD